VQIFRSIKRAGGTIHEIPIIPLFVLAMIIVVVIFADWLTPYSPTKGDLGNSLLPPAWMEGGGGKHLLGTDRFGRDVFTRLVFGARVSLSVAFLSIIVSAVTGSVLGLIAGYVGGKLDVVIMRAVDAGLSFPHVLIGIILAVVLGPSFTNVVIIVLIVLWPRFARQARGETLSIKQRDYVIAAKTMGSSFWTIIGRHIFPNVLPSLLVLATLEVGYVVILEATLSFLGAGLPPPQPSWGIMINEGRRYLEDAWWVSVFPGIAIGLTVFSLNMTGDWIRDKLDPKLRQV
jgi:peptide/nickel transport system permease protein